MIARLIRRRRPAPRATSFRPAEPYLAAAADRARELGHSSVRTEHVLLVLLERGALGAVLPEGLRDELLSCIGPSNPTQIDAEALAALGIDLDEVRRRLDETFGPDALERTRAGCLGVAPRLKLALAYAVDEARESAVADRHVLLGLVSVEESFAAQFLAARGIDESRVRTTLGYH